VRISKKAEYALRAVLAMGRRGASRSAQIQELSRTEDIPVKFLEQILLTLRKGSVLKSKRGAGGGYALNRPPEEISLGEIITMIDGPLLPSSCLEVGKPGHCGCGRPRPCGLAIVLGDLHAQMDNFLSKCTVADVVRREGTSAPMQFDI
jgi:Rrf2 family transcriptional regulator, iron-sulfur cluster assembly transcription factor